MRIESHRPRHHTAIGLDQVAPIRGRMSVNSDPGKSREEMDADFEQIRDEQPMTETCMWCGAVYIGLAGAGREWFRHHIAENHPEVKLPKPRGGKRRAWNRTGNDNDRDEAMVEVEARRAMLSDRSAE
jgi:hypothetical protein